MQAAVDRGPYCSALSDDAIAHFRAEVDKKVKSGQAKLVVWDSIKKKTSVKLKISPIAAIPHKSKLVIGRLDMYRTKVLMYRTMVLIAHPTKVRC